MKTSKKALYAVVLATLLATASGPILGDDKADAEQRATHIEERFKVADRNHDGKLTRMEAEATMPRIAKNFDKIDKDKKGYVTVEQVKAFAMGTP